MRNFILLPLLLILPLLVLSEASQHYKFSECRSTSLLCRGLPSVEKFFDISYPFRVPSMPDYCGLLGYDITCKNNNTDSAMMVLEIDKKIYKICFIFYEEQTISLVNPDFLGDVCLLPQTNTTSNLSRFNYTAEDLNLTLHFNCSLNVSSSTPNHVPPPPSKHTISDCPQGSNLHGLYYSLPEDDPSLRAELLRICNSSVLIPIFNHYNVQGGMGFWGAIQNGFSLNWASDDTRWCRRCTETGGICLRDQKSPGKPKCSCNNDGSITNGTCNSNSRF